jgi:hypothetical protein
MRIGQAGLAHGNARNAHGKCHNFLDFFHPTSSVFISFYQFSSASISVHHFISLEVFYNIYLHQKSNTIDIATKVITRNGCLSV